MTAPELSAQEKERILRGAVFSLSPLRLKVLPSKTAKKLVVLEAVAELFYPGETYTQAEVNARLEGSTPTPSPCGGISWISIFSAAPATAPATGARNQCGNKPTVRRDRRSPRVCLWGPPAPAVLCGIPYDRQEKGVSFYGYPFPPPVHPPGGGEQRP